MLDDEKEKLKVEETATSDDVENTDEKTESDTETKTGEFISKEEFDTFSTEILTRMDLMQSTIDGFNPVIEEEKEENEDEKEIEDNVSHETSESDLEEMDKFLNS